MMTPQEFAATLSRAEKRYLLNRVHRYSGLDGSTAKEQFQRIVEYVLNFLDGDSEVERSIFAKTMKAFG